MSASNDGSPAVATHPVTMATQIPSLRALLAGRLTARHGDSDSLNMPSLEPMASRSIANLFPATSHIWPGASAAGVAASASPAQSPLRTTRRSARLAQAETSSANASPDSRKPEATPSASTRRSNKRKPPPSSSPPQKKRRGSLKKPPPSNTPEETDGDRKPAPLDLSDCTICMCQPELSELSTISGCEHKFCFSCIAKWADRENTCPLCKSRFTKISRVNPGKGKKRTGQNSKKVKQRDQRSDFMSGGALEGLLASLAANGSLPAARFNHHFILAARSNAPAASAADNTRRAPQFAFALDQFFDSDDDEEGAQFPPHSFINVFMSRASFARGQRPIVPPFAASMPPRRTTARMSAGGPAPPRMTATSPHLQRHPPHAGTNASNALEIADDSDEDDFVEVVEYSRST